MIYTPLAVAATAREIGWIENYELLKDDGDFAGVAYVGTVKDPDVMTRMMALTGCFLRNYVDAKMMTLQEVIGYIRNNEEPEATVLLIPNFYLPSGEEGSVANWLVSGLYGMLLSRYRDGLQTVVYIQDLERMKKDYGREIAKFMEERYFDIMGD